jgi:hypothetical protein
MMPKAPLRIEIPESKKDPYEQNGWMLDNYTCARDHWVRMTHPNEFRPFGIHKLRDIEKRRLWMIQPGRINRDTESASLAPCDESSAPMQKHVRFYRTGLIEYSRESLQFSLSVAQSLHFDMRLHVLSSESAQVGATDMFERPLFIATWMSDPEDLLEYEIELAELAGDSSLSHGAAFFHWGNGFSSPRLILPNIPPDFWWDVRNHTFFSFDEKFMNSFFLNLKSY